MSNKIQFKRGAKANLPTLAVGEPALCTDTSQLFVGGNSGNIELAKATDLSDVAQDRIYYCGTASGTNAYTVSNSKITAYTAGMTVRIIIGTTNTVAGCTLTIGSLGTITILDTAGNTIPIGGLKAGLPYQLCYNGTNFIVLGKGGGGGNATPDKILNGYTATNDSGPITGTIPTIGYANIPQGCAKYAEGDLAVYLAQTGYYVGGMGAGTSEVKVPVSQLQSADPNLVASNIKNGVNIFGITGSVTTQSLGGLTYTTGSTAVSLTSGQSTTINLPFEPRILIFTAWQYNSTSVGGAQVCVYIKKPFVDSNYPFYPYGSSGTSQVYTSFTNKLTVTGSTATYTQKESDFIQLITWEAIV